MLSLRPSKPKPEKRVKTKKRKSKTPRQLMEIRLDKLVKQIVVLRDGFCVCPKPENGHTDVMQPGHIISRGKEAIKWDLRNVHCQCSGCNMRHEHYPEIYINWYIETFGAESWAVLFNDREKVAKLTIDDLERLEFALTEIYKAQEAAQVIGKVYKPYFTQKELLEFYK